MNILRNLWIVVGVCCLLAACRDNEVTPAESTADDCLTATSQASGRIVEGQYIIAYTDESSTALSAGRAEARSAAMLREHHIAGNALMKSFALV